MILIQSRQQLAFSMVIFAGVFALVWYLCGAEAKRERTAFALSKVSLGAKERMHGRNTHTNAIGDYDPSQYVPKSNLHPESTNLLVNAEFTGPGGQAVVQDDIKLATKGDGAFRNVEVNGYKVPRTYIKEAAFRNQDFVFRDEFPIFQKPDMIDTERKDQRSMFGPIKKMANVNGFGIDVMRQNSNADISIANAGGRYEE